MRSVIFGLALSSALSLTASQLRADEVLIKVGTLGGSTTLAGAAESEQPAVKETNKNHRLSLSYGLTDQEKTHYFRFSQYERTQKFSDDSAQSDSWEKGFGLGYSIRRFEPIFTKTSVFVDVGLDLEQGRSESSYQGLTKRQSIRAGSEVGLRLQSDQGMFFEFSTQLVELSYTTLESKAASKTTTKSWNVATIGQTSMGSARLGVGFQF